jgi:signal transduction histidine kinase
MAGMGTMMDTVVRAAFVDAVGSALILGVGAAILVAVVAAVIISARLARPISDLAVASRQVAAGDYAQRVPEGSGELGDLAASFNEMAASLDATERRRHELIGDVAHELRTPIASLRGYVEGLDEGVFMPGPDSWRVLGDQVSRLARLVDDLSDLWRAEALDMVLAPEDLDGQTLVADAVQRHRAAAVARSIELTSEAVRPVRLWADRARVAQVLDNLVGNALRYTQEGGRVRVCTVARGETIEITVSDTGPGLATDQLARVFERFYRVDPSRSRDVGGSGLGLAIARALTEAMGGRIWATSPGPGMGATFGVELPAARSHAAMPARDGRTLPLNRR